MHIYGRDQQAFKLRRSYGEKFLLHCFTFVSCVQVACFLLAIIRTANAAGNAMENNFFFSSKLQLKPFYFNDYCGVAINYPRTFFSNVTFHLEPFNVSYLVCRCATNIRMLFTCVALHLVICVINRSSVWVGVRDVRYHFVILRKDLFTVWEVFLMVVSFILLWTVNSENQVLALYLRSCRVPAAGTFSQIMPYTELYVSLFLALALWVINAIAGVFVRCRKNPRDKLIKEEKAQRELLNQMNGYDPEKGDHNNHEQPLNNTMGNHVGDPVIASAATHGMSSLDPHLQPKDPVFGGGGTNTQSTSHSAAVVAAAAAAPPSSFSFGPSVSRPQTPTTVGLEHRGFSTVDSAADLAGNISWRSRDLTDRVVSPSAVVPVVGIGTGPGTSSSRFHPPPPPSSSSNLRRGGQYDGATEDTVEL